MAKQLVCSSCSATKDEMDFTPEEAKKSDTERVCTACQQEADGGDDWKIHRRMYACEDANWQACLLEDLNEDGTATIRRSDDRDADNADGYGNGFKIPTHKLAKFDAAKLNTPHDRAEIGGIGASNLTAAIRAFTQKRIEEIDSNSTANKVTERLYYIKLLKPFKTRFPVQQQDFYSWTTAVDSYEVTYSKAPPDMVFDKVQQSLDSSNKAAWREHRVVRYRDHLSLHGLVDSADVRRDYLKSLDTLEELQRFAIKRAQVSPDMSLFQELVSKLVTFKNENPKDTLRRIEQFYHEFTVIRDRLNPVIPRKLRSFRTHEKLDQIQRVFITQNNQEMLDNAGKLNGKVKQRMSQKWEELQKEAADPDDETHLENMYLQITKYIRDDLAESVLPSLNETLDEEGRHWTQYRRNSSLFTSANQRVFRSRTPFSGTPKKRDRDYHSISNSKGPKRVKVQDDRIPRCRYGVKCRNEQRSRCRFFHPPKERKQIHAKRAGEPAKGLNKGRDYGARDSAKPDRSRDRNRSPKRINNNKHSQNESGNCKYAQNCTFWQRGICNRAHNAREMKCSSCGIPGHPACACRRSKVQNAPSAGPPRYTTANPNHPGVMPMQPLLPHFYTASYQQKAIPQQIQQQQTQQQPAKTQSTPHHLAMAQDLLQHAQRNYSTIKRELGRSPTL